MNIFFSNFNPVGLKLWVWFKSLRNRLSKFWQDSATKDDAKQMLFQDTLYRDMIPVHRTYNSGDKSSFPHPNTVDPKLSLTDIVFSKNKYLLSLF